MKLLALADTHIGAGYEHRKDALADAEGVLDQIVDLAVARNVSLILHGGDVFHRAKPDPAALHVFKRFCQQLAEAEIPMIGVGGNGLHEAPMGQRSALELFESRLVRVSRTPEYITEFAGVAICTLPAVSLARLAASRNGKSHADLAEEAIDLLLASARDLYDAAPDDRPRILLAHQMVSGASLPTGLPVEQVGSSVLPLWALEEIGFDAVVLGDIHKPQNFGRRSIDAPVFYCGSPMCHDFGEANEQHGVWLLEFDEGGVFSGLEFVPLEDRRFVTVNVDLAASTTHSEGSSRSDGSGKPPDAIPGDGEEEPGEPQEPHAGAGEDSTEPGPAQSGLDETDTIAAAIAEQFPLTDAVVRVRYRGTEEQHRRIDQPALLRLLDDAGVHRVYGGLQWEPVRSTRVRVEGVDETLAPLAAVDLWLSVQDDISAASAESLRELLREWVAA